MAPRVKWALQTNLFTFCPSERLIAFVYSAKRTQLLRCSLKSCKPLESLKRPLLGTAVASIPVTHDAADTARQTLVEAPTA